MDINLKEHYTSLDPENEEELLSAGLIREWSIQLWAY
jgi:hypothetical protein